MCVCICTDVNRLRSMLDKGGAVKNFVNALQQLTNPEMIFKVRAQIWAWIHETLRVFIYLLVHVTDDLHSVPRRIGGMV